MTHDQLLQAFAALYGKQAESVFFAPGRVNLIGEHTDYNGGPVFPCALTFGTYLLLARNNADVLRFRSLNMPQAWETDITAERSPLPDRSWVNYPLGTIAQMEKAGLTIHCGFDMLFYGDVPQGAGLSSSASIEVVTAFAFNNLYGSPFGLVQIARFAQEAEHVFAGVNCGIMDQFASACGKREHAICLDCNSLEYELVPLNMNGVKIVLSNTCSPHKLESSLYNKRVAECGEALRMLQKEVQVKCLADVSLDELKKYAAIIKDKIVYRRALHVVSETERTKKAVKALKSGDLALFGQLMNESHISLRDNYEVTGFELDTMAEAAWNTDGVIGSRMTGGGFGGCTVSLVREDAVERFISQVGAEYRQKAGIKPEFYVADAGDGARRLM